VACRGKTPPLGARHRGAVARFALRSPFFQIRRESASAATWYNHSPADVVSFFGGLELAGPGVTEARIWPRRPPEADDRTGHVLAGVGRLLGM